MVSVAVIADNHVLSHGSEIHYMIFTQSLSYECSHMVGAKVPLRASVLRNTVKK